MEKLQNIKWKQNGENLTIYWDWYDESVEKVLVYWKKREFQENSYGIAFGDPVFKTPGMKTGSVSQKIGTSWGLYTFTFCPILKGENCGRTEDEIKCEDRMLGERKKIYWGLAQDKYGTNVYFDCGTEKLSGNWMRIAYRYDGQTFYFSPAYEINSSVKLHLPQDGIKIANISEITAKEPYDRAYEITHKR